MRSLRFLVATLLGLFLWVPALAQDYTTTWLAYPSAGTGNQYVSPPVTRTTHNLVGPSGGAGGTFADLPFAFPYCGASYTRVWICSQGFIQFGVTGTSGSLAWSNTSWPPSGTEDGMVAPLWDDLNMDPSIGGRGSCVSWTTGTAPDRTWIVSWEGVTHFNNGTPAGTFTFQIQLSETTGRIVFAYDNSNPATWSNLSYSAGIDAPNGLASDGRSWVGGVVRRGWPWNDYVASGSANLAGHPLYDIQFDPRQVTYTGTILYDRLVTDASGTGSSVQSGVPVAGLAVEVRRPDGSLGFAARTDANGAFSLTGVGMNGAQTGNLVLVASSPACAVRSAPGSGAHVWTIQSNVTQSANYVAGTRTLGATQDPTGIVRAPFHVAQVITETAAWVEARSGVTLPQLEVIYNTSSASPTAFTYEVPLTSTPARLQIGSTGAPNPDGWDAWIIRRGFGRHVLSELVAPISVPANLAFDAVTDDENAFAEAFGTYLHAAITGATTVFDGTSTTSATQWNLESLSTSQRKGGDVASRVAAALFDLADGANESFDAVDGTLSDAADRPLDVASRTPAPLTASTFLARWVAEANPPAPASRLWIANGIIDDDASEPNDTAPEAVAAGTVPFSRPNLVLAQANEDWWEFGTAEPGKAVAIEVAFDRAAYRTGIVLQVLSTGGTVLASGVPVGTTGPFRATTGALAVGTYRVRVAHASGPTIARYTLQGSVPLVFTSNQGPGWTAGRPLSIQLTATGGVPPYAIAVAEGTTLPQGLSLDAANLRVTGIPATPGAGTVQVTLTDSGSPAHVLTVGGAFTVSEAVTVDSGPFTPFALGRSHDRPMPVRGGTAPFQVTLGGSLPEGIVLDANAHRFRGTPGAQGSTPFRLDVTDAAGSADGADGVAVVCVPSGTEGPAAVLAEGSAATGFWFDAIEGSTASVRVTTGKGQPARKLVLAILGPDGQPVPGAKGKGGTGRASASKIPCARSGRYFVVLSSTSGAATELRCVAKSVLPARATKKLTAVAAGSTFEFRVGALAGAVLKFKATPDRPSGAKLGLALIEGPDGSLLDLGTAGTVKEVANGIQVEATLPSSGTWRVVLVCKPGADAKKAAWSWSVKQPSGVTFDVGDSE